MIEVLWHGRGGQGAFTAALVAIDYDFCKGCGVCARACAFDAIAMVSEREALAAEAAASANDRTKEAVAR